jgi:hypothetical protein
MFASRVIVRQVEIRRLFVVRLGGGLRRYFALQCRIHFGFMKSRGSDACARQRSSERRDRWRPWSRSSGK